MAMNVTKKILLILLVSHTHTYGCVYVDCYTTVESYLDEYEAKSKKKFKALSEQKIKLELKFVEYKEHLDHFIEQNDKEINLLKKTILELKKRELYLGNRIKIEFKKDR